MALIAGLTVGVGPAAAASSTAQPTAIAKQSAPRADRVVGYYRTLGLCLRVGRIGEFRGRWDDFDCYRIRWGFHRGWWALEAQWNDWHDHGWPGDHHGWPGDDHHGWPGGPGGGGPGGGGPGGGGPGGGGPR
jgi:hypothetical protein